MRKNDSESFESTLSVDSAKKMESRFLRFVILSVSFGEKFEKFGLSERKTPLLACDQAPRWGQKGEKNQRAKRLSRPPLPTDFPIIPPFLPFPPTAEPGPRLRLAALVWLAEEKSSVFGSPFFNHFFVQSNI